MNPVVRVVRVGNRGEPLPLPRYESALAAGADLRADLESPVNLGPGERALIPTGLAIELPEGYEAQVRARSGLAMKHGIALVNGIGTIDADYRGELKVGLINLGQSPVTLNRGERIAQLVVAPVARAEFVLSEALTDTSRDQGGFGSTGR